MNESIPTDPHVKMSKFGKKLTCLKPGRKMEKWSQQLVSPIHDDRRKVKFYITHPF